MALDVAVVEVSPLALPLMVEEWLKKAVRVPLVVVQAGAVSWPCFLLGPAEDELQWKAWELVMEVLWLVELQPGASPLVWTTYQQVSSAREGWAVHLLAMVC